MSIKSLPDLCDDYPQQVQLLEPIFHDFGGNECFSGQVVTVKCYEDNSLVKAQTDLPGQGKVLVVDGGGSLRRSLLGDNLAKAAVDNDWSGIVIYGALRDVEIIRTLSLGVRAIAPCPMKTEKKGIGELNVVLQFAGVTIKPGMMLYADANGVLVCDKVLD